MLNVPMTPMERVMKTFFLERFGSRRPLVTDGELTDYIAWMASKYTGGVELFPDDPELREATKRFNSPGGRSSANVTGAYADHREGVFMRSENDISVGRMFRYMPAHWHTNEYFEIYYCAGGRCPVHFEHDVAELRPGDVLIVAPGVIHASPCYEDGAVLYYYMVRSSTFDKVFWNQLPSDSLMSAFFRLSLNHTKHAAYLHFETGEDADIELLLSRIEEESRVPRLYGQQLMNALMSELFVLLLRRYEGTVKLPRTESFYWTHRYSALFSYIQSHYTETDLSELSERFHYSERQIARIVESVTGESYRELITRLRMKKAGELLRRSVSVTDAAEACGYSTVPSFTRAFRRHYGVTPTQFK